MTVPFARPRVGAPVFLPLLALVALFFWAAMPCALAGPGRFPGSVPVPPGFLPPSSGDPEKVLRAFEGIPYRVDGAVDDEGRYVLFARPRAVQTSPGLNCSGFVLEACRFLFNENIPLERAKLDRLKDSGPGSPHGEDWDFGWDLILNVSEGRTRALILPGGKTADPAAGTGFAPRGFDLHGSETWKELPARIKPGRLYLVSFNRDSSKPGYAMQHYHVGVIYASGPGRMMMWQTTGGAKRVYGRNLADAGERAAFLRAFANTGGVRKYILVLEVELPGR